ncbi:selenocysteine lyase/cysteine desulfurase [Hasllibacter halocynthiae]|uniref:Selenocysteine lyase/cysteine desulfurase n=1 Tax=Hasllibacter halocynthiae TaxID=595589 RepID=A0A2T0X8K5_9RHOB|nr:aminotransferase class V-fold PLP-dependent enzyme [Hasllibacter halocynthiae]PRY95282.1 selenocysteine lyase/cysteine desulfurase [Hasllibacter halocynthiae]
MRLDLDFVRAQFPAFQEPGLRNRVHAENAGGSFPCRQVIWRLHRFYRERKVQPGFDYAASRTAQDEMDEARWRLAPMLGIEVGELHFGPSTTANAYVMANAVRQMLRGEGRPGVVVVTDQDHEASGEHWRRLAGDGAEVREWRMRDGSLRLEDLRPLLEGADVLTFPHVSDVVGEVNDAAAICAATRRAGAMTVVDGVNAAPHGLPNVRKLGADVYLFSAHKTFGPHQGLMAVGKEAASRLPSQGQGDDAIQPGIRFAPAGADHAQVAACAGIADYLDALYAHHEKAGRDGAGRAGVIGGWMREQEVGAMTPVLDWASGRNDVRLLGPPGAKGRVPTMAFEMPKAGAAYVAPLAALGVMAAGQGLHARRTLRALGIDPAHGVLRISFAHYTSEADGARVAQALDAVA